MVVMDRQDYVNKAQVLLGDRDTYRPISKDPIPKLKNQLIQIFKNFKSQGPASKATYKRLYPMCAIQVKFYGLSKIHRQGTPLRPILSSRGSITYGVVKELASIL